MRHVEDDGVSISEMRYWSLLVPVCADTSPKRLVLMYLSGAMRALGPASAARPWAFAPVTLAVACHGRGEGTPPLPSPSAESAMILGGEQRAHTLGELAVAADYTMSVESDKECL